MLITDTVYKTGHVLPFSTGRSLIAISSLIRNSFTFPGTNLIVGTKKGHLINYKVPLKGPLKNRNSEIVLQNLFKNFYKKPAQQLEVVSQADILIILVG